MDGTKRCTKCGKDRPHSEFAPVRQNIDGLQYHCKSCQATYTRAYYQRHKAKARAAIRRAQAKNPGYKGDYDRAYFNAHRLEKAARDAVAGALRSGVLVKPDRCECCGEIEPLVGHHDDYSKPLEVRWWCRSCHRRNHGKHKAPPVAVEMLL